MAAAKVEAAATATVVEAAAETAKTNAAMAAFFQRVLLPLITGQVRFVVLLLYALLLLALVLLNQ